MENSSTENLDDRQIFALLIKKMRTYHPSDDFSMIEKAYLLAKEAHADQLRKSGELYIIHPLSVAVILAGLELDIETIVAGILHDVIEDTPYIRDDISRMFSEEIAQIVDGVTKLEKIEYTTLEEEQAENYRKMFLAMAEDIRVILIKVADRLHNLRTLKFMSEEKQKEKAQETLDIYAPIAHRLGISKIRYELEDLSFRYLNPDAYYDLKEKIQRKQSEREDYVSSIVRDLKQKMTENEIECQIEGRPKHFFSIYKKMVGQDKTLDQIYDLFAVRILVDSVRDCYGALGLVHEMYRPIPGRFKDYIAMPKSNMYSSLHNTLIGPEGEPFEIQIRTHEMHRTAEYGIAAHWKYKSGQGGSVDDREEAKLSWLRQILEWQREYSDNKEYLAALKFDLNVYKDHIYCFSPKGEVISLINGSTPIDFAFAIHSAVGNKMVGAKVNGKIVTINQPLNTGDRVEIMTSQNSKGPSRDWLKIVKSSQAKSKINQWFKKENKEENIARGKDLLEKGAKKKNMSLSELLSPKRVEAVLNRFSLHDWDSVCAAVGYGGIRETQVINRLHEEYLREEGKTAEQEEAVKKLVTLEIQDNEQRRHTNRTSISVKGIGDIAVRFSKCCSPVPGDEIVGFVTRGRGVSIHRTDCVNMINLDDLERHRIIDAEWKLPEKATEGVSFRADIKIVCEDHLGILVEVSRVFTDEKIDVKSLNARTVKDEAIINVGIVIKSKTELDRIMQKLLSLNSVHGVERVTT
jgi:GTP pyrophosphokinase